MTTLQPGDAAPAFSVTDQSGTVHTLSQYEGQKLVLFFYPKDNTPGCTAEACNLRDHYAELQEAGYALLGISPDSERKHQNFIEKFDLPFPLLADTDHAMLEAYGVWGPKKFMGRDYDGVHRTTFVIDEAGKVDRVIKKVKTKDHAAQILEA